MYTMVCLFEYVLANSWHFSCGSQRWAQHVLAYHEIHHDQTLCECLRLTRPLTVAAKMSRGSDFTLNLRSIMVYTDVHNKALGCSEGSPSLPVNCICSWAINHLMVAGIHVNFRAFRNFFEQLSNFMGKLHVNSKNIRGNSEKHGNSHEFRENNPLWFWLANQDILIHLCLAYKPT